MGWLIAFGVLLGLAVLPLGVLIGYDAQGPLVRVVAGPLKITVFPGKGGKKKKEPKQRTPSREAAEKPKEEPLPRPPEKPKPVREEKKPKGGSLMDFIPLVKIALDFLGDFRRKLRMDRLYLRLIMASSDPCDLAVNYGRTWAAVGNLMPRLERLFVIKDRDIEVECDFTATQTLVTAKLQITITLGRLLALLAVYGFRALKEFLTIKKKRKGGAVT